MSNRLADGQSSVIDRRLIQFGWLSFNNPNKFLCEQKRRKKVKIERGCDVNSI